MPKKPTDSAPESATLTRSERYFNKELSWLAYHDRILDLIEDTSTPLLQRLRYIRVFAKNDAEFTMVRLAGLCKMAEEGLASSDSPDRADPSTVARESFQRLGEQHERLDASLTAIYEELKQAGVNHYRQYADLPKSLQELWRDYYLQNIQPILTPLAHDQAHPFPYLKNRVLYLALMGRPNPSDELTLIGFIEVPTVIPRLLLDKGSMSSIPVEEVISEFAKQDFPFGVEITEVATLRVLRNLDYDLLENEVVDLLKNLQRTLNDRTVQEAVRIDVEDTMPESIRSYIASQLDLTTGSTVVRPKPLGPGFLANLNRLPRPDLKERPFNPRIPKRLASQESLLSLIESQDLLLHLPYESFYTVVEFIHEAAHNPNVVAIKQVVYRTAGESPMLDALITAAENGKKVTVVFELKARFDEKSNIRWAHKLERAGVSVCYGFVGLKTHVKTTLVTMRRDGEIKQFCHISTGNYDYKTARSYADLMLFTTEPAICRDIGRLFNLLTGFHLHVGEERLRSGEISGGFEELAIAPLNLREALEREIDQEITQARRHGTGQIIFKLNTISDERMIEKLYAASSAGVKVDLIVRGACCVRPGVRGISDNIRVWSLVDQFMEHDRVFLFGNVGKPKVFLGSGDLMNRNLDRRIEILLPIKQESFARRIEDILSSVLADDHHLWKLAASGEYVRAVPPDPAVPNRAQLKFIDEIRHSGIKSVPYEQAIRHRPGRKRRSRPVAKS